MRRLELDEGPGLPDWRAALERRQGKVLVVENRPLTKEAVYTETARPPEHHHSTDEGGQPVIVFDLHGTLTPARGFPLSPPWPGVKEALDWWAGKGVCLHLASKTLSPYHSPLVLKARRALIDAWIVEHSLPISFVTGKVAAHVYYDDRMVPVGPDGDWEQVRADVDAQLAQRCYEADDGTLKLLALPERGKPIEDFPDLEDVPDDSPRGLSGPVLDVDVHRCLSEANSSTREGELAPGALEALQVIYAAGYTVHLSCAGWDPSTHDRDESQQRLAAMRAQVRQAGVPYDEFVSKDHGTAFVDDKGICHRDWETDLPLLLAALAKPAPEDEITPLPSGDQAQVRALQKAAPLQDDPRWDRMADFYTARLTRALRLGLNPRAVAEGWAAAAPRRRKAARPDSQDAAEHYVRSLAIDRQPLTSELEALSRDGYIGGLKAAIGQIDQPDEAWATFDASFDWADWTPGNTAAAGLLRGLNTPGLHALLERSGADADSIAETRLGELARVLAEAADRGDSVDSIAAALEEFFSGPKRARLVAHTGLAWAVTAATEDLYRAHQILWWDWLVGARPCPECDDMAAGGPYELGQESPPLHPGCRCSMAPADVPLGVRP